jgi:hypothetical protein
MNTSKKKATTHSLAHVGKAAFVNHNFCDTCFSRLVHFFFTEANESCINLLQQKFESKFPTRNRVLYVVDNFPSKCAGLPEAI